MENNKILTSPSSMGQVGPKPFELLKEHAFEVINNPYGRKLTEDEVIELASDCVGIVAGVEPLTKKVLDACKHLKCISRVGVGMDNVDLEYAKEKGITVVNTPKGPTRAVAEMVVGMTFALLRHIPQADADLKNRIWKKRVGNLLQGKVIGVLGLGNIGRTTAEMFRGLGNEVIGFDLKPNKAWGREYNVTFMSLSEVLSNCDILTIHIPSKSDGAPVIGETEINRMKDGSFFINLSRGGVVDEKAMIQALKNEKLTAAAIDVFSQEPYSGPLCDLQNVILTPHLGSYAKEGKLQMEIDAVQNLIDELSKSLNQ